MTKCLDCPRMVKLVRNAVFKRFPCIIRRMRLSTCRIVMQPTAAQHKRRQQNRRFCPALRKSFYKRVHSNF
ncbi:MAG: hypothetical protein ACM3UY_01310 [Methanocella sp.]